MCESVSETGTALFVVYGFYALFFIILFIIGHHHHHSHQPGCPAVQVLVQVYSSFVLEAKITLSTVRHISVSHGCQNMVSPLMIFSGLLLSLDHLLVHVFVQVCVCLLLSKYFMNQLTNFIESLKK